jgi:TonB family protein
VAVVYYAGAVAYCLIIIFQLLQLLRVIQHSATYRLNQLRIAESNENKPTFSFFYFIFIGQADKLTAIEKEQVILHESVHARQWHSFDILLINILKIFFWFNPFIATYKKIFIQLHEFEADARAVKNSNVNTYCGLLARVALQSANMTIANHFNNSLTIKRIEMMRTIKKKINRWKVFSMVVLVPLVFVFIACQDQIGDEIGEIAKNSTHALVVPEHVQKRFDLLKSENPNKNYVLLELNDAASQRLEALKADYGLPKSIEIFTIGDETSTTNLEPVIGTGNIIMQRNDAADRGDEQTFAIMEFNEQTKGVAEASRTETVYTVVQEQPEFPGGYEAMMDYLRENIRYPVESRENNEQGTVYVSFVVGSDGSISEVKTIRGVSQFVDAEAVRVVRNFAKWKPGKQDGKNVSVRFVLPIKFHL